MSRPPALPGGRRALGGGRLALGPRPLFLLTLALAGCSIVYELLLAQTLAATLGDTLLRYNVTIGLYLASLGLGAMLAAKAADLTGRLADVELALSLLGALGPFLIIAVDGGAARAVGALGLGFRGWAHQALVYGFDHGIIVLVGLLSGFELPLLMRLGEYPESDRSNEVLAVDYAGTLLGAACFPFLILPGLGVLTGAAATGLLNALCGLYLVLFAAPARRGRGWAYAGAVALCLGLLAWREPLHLAAARLYVLR